MNKEKGSKNLLNEYKTKLSSFNGKDIMRLKDLFRINDV